MGFRPRMPSTLIAQLPVEEISVDDYVARLGKHFQDMYADLRHKYEALEEDRAGRGAGRQSAQLSVGDLVLLKRNPSTRREGPLRFQGRVYEDIYRIVQGSHPTFRLRPVGDPNKPIPVRQPVSADNLVKLDMPELELDPDAPRVLEIQEDRTDPESAWVRYKLEGFSVDGSVKLRNQSTPAEVQWVDLSKKRYRWML